MTEKSAPHSERAPTGTRKQPVKTGKDRDLKSSKDMGLGQDSTVTRENVRKAENKE